MINVEKTNDAQTLLFAQHHLSKIKIKQLFFSRVESETGQPQLRCRFVHFVSVLAVMSSTIGLCR